MQEYPSYGDLIDILEAAEIASETDRDKLLADILTEKFTARYPHIPISRPSRFLDTVGRLAAPTKPSTVGQQKLTGSALASYRRRNWIPRNRNKQGMLWINKLPPGTIPTNHQTLSLVPMPSHAFPLAPVLIVLWYVTSRISQCNCGQDSCTCIYTFSTDGAFDLQLKYSMYTCNIMCTPFANQCTAIIATLYIAIPQCRL